MRGTYGKRKADLATKTRVQRRNKAVLIFKVLRNQRYRAAHVPASHPVRVDLCCDHLAHYGIQSERATACSGEGHREQVYS